ncbi:hypothetical protein C0416_01450 [bacterium]|nr:hypothetical protein [bacterium]
MSKTLFTIVAFMAVTLFFNSNSAQAAVSDCASQGCVAVCDSSNVEMYFNDGTHAGTIPGVGTGGCYIDADEGYLIINRTSGTTYVYNVQTGTSCSFGYAGQNALIFGSQVYVASGANHKIARVELDCSGYTEILVPGTYPWGMTKDSTTIYVLNSQTANITTIVPPSTTPTYNSIGRVFGDQLTAIRYHAGNNKLFMGGLNAIYEASLPLDGTSTLWQTISTGVDEMSLTSTHLGVSSNSGNSAHLIPITNPSSYMTMGCQSCRSVALNDTNFFSVGGTSPDLNVRAWDMTGTQRAYSPITTVGSNSAAWLAPTVTGPVCPNGTKEGTEECDGTQFGTATCQTLGFDGGNLSCSESCQISTSACFYNCGNGSIEAPEECDGINLNSATCESLGFDSGTLSCSASCEFVTTQCVTETCGNGQLDSGEDCDGANLNSASCLTLGFDGGTLSCSPTSCTFDTSACTVDLCGNEAIDDGEDCDGINLNGATCQTQGFDGGSLSCESCTLNTTACTMTSCGNGAIDTNEECDDGNTNAGDGCGGNCQVEEGYVCNGQPSECTPVETCNQDGLVAGSDSGLELSKLSSHNLALYNTHLSGLTKVFNITCGTVETLYGNQFEAITVTLPSGSYSNLSIQIGNKVAECHFFAEEGSAKIHISKESPESSYVDPTSGPGAGVICTEDNANVQVQFQGLLLGALGTGFSYRLLSANPITSFSGNWIEIYVSDSSVKLQEIAVATNNIVVANSDMSDGPIYIDLDDMGDFSEIFQPHTDKPPKGCGCSTFSGNGNSSLPVAFLSILVLFVIRRRKASGSN